MKIIFAAKLSIVSFLILSCIQKQNTEPGSVKIDSLKKTEVSIHDKEIDTIGPTFSTIEFNVKATGEELKNFEDGIIPWISIDNPKPHISRIIDADKIVLKASSVTLIIDYPLTTPAVFVIKSSGQGFSRRQLITEISKLYHEIYKEEERTANTKTIPLNKREGLVNRNKTDGKYGVWGHDISDLDLSSIEVHKNSNGHFTLVLNVES